MMLIEWCRSEMHLEHKFKSNQDGVNLTSKAGGHLLVIFVGT
jgi:hypothetical protein